jgi:S-adenosylmethionine synthetase
MPYLFTSESVSEGHPDKIADQISDAILDQFLAQDPNSKVACETLVTTGLTVVSGEVRSKAYVDVQSTTREVIRRIGYVHSAYKFDADACGVLSALHEQSENIYQGVSQKNPLEQGAGDQGMMFGFATNETANYMPLALDLSHALLRELAAIRRESKEMPYLRPDAKSQVTIEYNDDHTPRRIDTIVLSTQHDPYGSKMGPKNNAQIQKDIKGILIPRVIKQQPESIQNLFAGRIKYFINPTGEFEIGGPHADTGLTGRKIIVDTYGGKGAHGGGAFSGKDPSKVDRSAAYAARHAAKNLVAAGIADQILVQVSYAIGVAKPMGIFVDTYGTAKVALTDAQIAERIGQVFDMRPGAIIRRLKLKQPIYEETAAYGHMGRQPRKFSKTFQVNGKAKKVAVETFTWEKLDYVAKVKKAFKA